MVRILQKGRRMIAVKNGYPKYLFRGGKGAKITITYFGKFGGQGSDLRRTDYINGEVSGLTDMLIPLILDGREIEYEPFWARTFRFVCIKVWAKEETVTILIPMFCRTGYPLCIETAMMLSGNVYLVL